jgi:fucose 4-O-acetylase-like acetyltransferase
MAGAYLWTEYCVGTGWSWMQAMGKNSLMVYWVHVMIVYGSLVQPIKRTLSIAQGALAVVIVTVAMVAMSALWLAWKRRRAAAVAAPVPAVP